MKKCELIAYFKYFYVDKDLINLIIFTTYQNIIYILPLPHELNIPILSVLLVFIVLSVFYCIPVSGIICIYGIYCIICTICIYLLWTKCGH